MKPGLRAAGAAVGGLSLAGASFGFLFGGPGPGWPAASSLPEPAGFRSGPGAGPGPGFGNATAPAGFFAGTARAATRMHDFYFTRAAYSGYGYGGFRGWDVDFPKADQQFLVGLRRLTNLDAYEYQNPILLSDPNLGRFPFLYAVEVGFMHMTEAEVEGLRRYLLSGGFLLVDDFWGTHEWSNFVREMGRVLPDHQIVDIPLDHPVFRSFYTVTEIIQVPNVGQGVRGGPTWEKDGYVPMVRGIFDPDGRLMVAVNWNTDLGDGWEWADNPYYPLRYFTYAYQMGVNFIVYAMTH